MKKRLLSICIVLTIILTGCTDTQKESSAEQISPVPSPAVGAVENSDTQSAGATEVSSELKAFLDSYEEFMERYIDFLADYQAAADQSSMLTEYLSLMQEYADFAAKAEAYNDAEMNTVDAAYYLEVTSRVAQKLLSALPDT